MIRRLWKLTKGYRLAPWKSPYLRWRLETYLGIPADAIGPGEFFRLLWTHRRDFLRYLRWADRMAARYGG